MAKQKRERKPAAPAESAEPVELIDELQPPKGKQAKSNALHTTRGHEERVGEALITSR